MAQIDPQQIAVVKELIDKFVTVRNLQDKTQKLQLEIDETVRILTDSQLEAYHKLQLIGKPDDPKQD